MIVEADLDSAEMRVMCALAGDKPWKHTTTALDLFGRVVEKGSEEYTFAKAGTYRWFYTHPDKAPSLDPGQLRTYKVVVNPETLMRFSHVMNLKHPGIVQWKRGTIATLRNTGMAWTPFGRFRDLNWAIGHYDPKLKAEAENKALNWPIQGAIGDVIKRAYKRAWDHLETYRRFGRSARLVFQCHDSLGVYTQDDTEIPSIIQILKESIEVPIPELGGLLIPAEFKVGPSWGEVKPYTG